MILEPSAIVLLGRVVLDERCRTDAERPWEVYAGAKGHSPAVE